MEQKQVAPIGGNKQLQLIWSSGDTTWTYHPWGCMSAKIMIRILLSFYCLIYLLSPSMFPLLDKVKRWRTQICVQNSLKKRSNLPFPGYASRPPAVFQVRYMGSRPLWFILILHIPNPSWFFLDTRNKSFELIRGYRGGWSRTTCLLTRRLLRGTL